jgi:hypothetical protein
MAELPVRPAPDCSGVKNGCLLTLSMHLASVTHFLLRIMTVLGVHPSHPASGACAAQRGCNPAAKRACARPQLEQHYTGIAPAAWPCPAEPSQHPFQEACSGVG